MKNTRLTLIHHNRTETIVKYTKFEISCAIILSVLSLLMSVIMFVEHEYLIAMLFDVVSYMYYIEAQLFKKYNRMFNIVENLIRSK